MDVGSFVFPRGDAFGSDQLIGLEQIGSNRQSGIFIAGSNQLFEKPQVPIRRFDEYLGLILGLCPFFEVADGPYTFGRFDRQVSVEGEGLSVLAGSHQGQNDGGRAHQRNDFDFMLMGEGDQIGTRIGHSRNSGFGEYTGIRPVQDRDEQFGYLSWGRVFVQFGELQRIDRTLHTGSAQKAPGRPDILDNEVADPIHHIPVEHRKDIPHGPVADRRGTPR